MFKCIDNKGHDDNVPNLSNVHTLQLGEHAIKYQVLEKPSSKDQRGEVGCLLLTLILGAFNFKCRVLYKASPVATPRGKP